MNRSKDLRELFHLWVDRKEKERKSSSVYNPSSNYPPHNPYYSGYNNDKDDDDSFDGEIFFYEWSNVSNVPKQFKSIDEFKKFLRSCGIFLAKYQEDIIRNLRWAYITCKIGSTDLMIRQTYGKLHQDLVKLDKKDDVTGTTIRPNNNVPSTIPSSSGGILGMRPQSEEVKEWFG